MSTKGKWCVYCGHTEEYHDRPGGCWSWGCSCERTDGQGKMIAPGFVAVELPEEHERASALAVTTWTCPYPECGAENDVWGEGAVGSWMECGTCLSQAWLDMDRGVDEALGVSR